MPDVLYETDNKSIGSFPAINLESENLTFISHYHEELEVIYMSEGTISAFSGSNEIILNKGDICFFMPGEIHSFQSLTKNCMDILKLNLNTYVENIDFENIRLKNNIISPSDDNYLFFINIINELRDEYIQKKPGYEFAIRHCKNKIIQLILRNLEFEYADTSKNIALLNSINKFLEENYEGKISLDEAAKACHFSKYYFAHKLKEMTGMTFIQYLSSFRTEKAVKLLKTTNINITDIALKCGFGNLRSFNRTFRAMYGITPLTYRKLKRNSMML